MANQTTAERTGAQVAAAMVTAGKSKTWVAERTGIPYSTLGSKIVGRSEFNISELLAVATALGVHPSTLMPADLRSAFTLAGAA